MLVEFRVKNFRSFRDEQVLSFVAANDKSLRDTNTITTGRKEAPFLLRSAVLYGANGSGKSNLISALQLMRELVISSSLPRMERGFRNIQPFKLYEQSIHEPTEFEVTLIKDGVRYQYGFAVTRHRIVSEHLLVYKSSKAERWFERYFDPATGKDTYEFSATFKATKYLWEDHPLPDSLFLSAAILLKDQCMRPVYDWFEDELFIVNGEGPILGSLDCMRPHNRIPQKPEVYENYRDFLKCTDMTITKMPYSSGTTKIMSFSPTMFSIVSRELTVVVDDLDVNLHTLVLRKLVQMFHSSRINTTGSQLLFASHDTSLMDVPGLFRRDQIWLVDKNQEQASTLGSISDFKPRKNESIQESYLAGRYGGIPFLSDWV